MGFDLYREHDERDKPADYFRWNIWGFPPIRFLGELYGWIPMGTISPAWTDEDDTFHPEEQCGYESNSGQTVCAKDAKNWAEALKVAVKELKKRKTVKSNDNLDDEFFKERKKIWDRDAETIKNWFSSPDDIQYIEAYIKFLEKGEFNIH